MIFRHIVLSAILLISAGIFFFFLLLIYIIEPFVLYLFTQKFFTKCLISTEQAEKMSLYKKIITLLSLVSSFALVHLMLPADIMTFTKQITSLKSSSYLFSALIFYMQKIVYFIIFVCYRNYPLSKIVFSFIAFSSLCTFFQLFVSPKKQFFKIILINLLSLSMLLIWLYIAKYIGIFIFSDDSYFMHLCLYFLNLLKKFV